MIQNTKHMHVCENIRIIIQNGCMQSFPVYENSSSEGVTVTDNENKEKPMEVCLGVQ